jgi:hypothetical protein
MKTRILAITVLILGLALLSGTFLTSSGLAQEASPPRPSHIHIGGCDELGEVVQPLTNLTVPTGQLLGSDDAVIAEAAFTNIPQPLSAFLDEKHAIKVHLSRDQIQVYLACGDIGGTVDADGALIVGMKELDDSGYAGIAYLVPAANGGTNISVLIAQVIPHEGDAAAEQPAAASETPAAAEESAGPEVVDVSLTNFNIDMPTELAAGSYRFAIANNGAAPHNLVIEGEGVNKRLANNLQPGQSGFLNIDLAPGTYTVFCPVGEGAHRAQGMELTLTVT